MPQGIIKLPTPARSVEELTFDFGEIVKTVKYTDHHGVPHISVAVVGGERTVAKIWHWEVLPGMARRVGYNEICFLMPGFLLSISNPKYAPYVAQGCRWGVNVGEWLAHPGVYGDLWKAARNKANGVELCTECDGTGNWLGTSFKKCEPCKGTGGVGGTGITGGASVTGK